MQQQQKSPCFQGLLENSGGESGTSLRSALTPWAAWVSPIWEVPWNVPATSIPLAVQRIQPFLQPLGASISIPSEPARSGQMTRLPPLSAEKGSNPVDRFLMYVSGQLGPWDRTPQQTVLDGVLSTAALPHSSMAGSPSPKTHCKARTRTPSPAPTRNRRSRPTEVLSVGQTLTPPWQSLFALIGGGQIRHEWLPGTRCASRRGACSVSYTHL